MNRMVALPCIAVVALLLVPAVRSEKETFVPANDVSFTVAAEHRSYRVGEQIVVNYAIENVSNASVYVPREWAATCPSNPHIWAWFEDSTGRHFIPGYAGSCSSSPQTVLERMRREAFLLKPGQRLQGHVMLDTTLFGGLKPGAYRIEAVLDGWSDKDFNQEQQSQLQNMPAPFMRGEEPASTRITLMP